MKNSVLVTGGAGFIGQALVKRLVNDGRTVTVLDNFNPQIHGSEERILHSLQNLQQICKVIRADVRDRSRVKEALLGCDSVFHLAAETGTGQSMYEIASYCDVNVQGTAILLEEISASGDLIERVVVASSRSIYGEGSYFCETHGVVHPEARAEIDLLNGTFNPRCPQCKAIVTAVATSESAPASPKSIYAVTKLTQEQLVMTAGCAFGRASVALRFQNVFGPGQSLQNAYTGILSIFSNVIREGGSLSIFEDGEESRDFVYIDDVVDACIVSLDADRAVNCVVNVGSGTATSVRGVAETLFKLLDCEPRLEITGHVRSGDIRHNYADLGQASEILDFSPKWSFTEGADQFVSWVRSQEITPSGYAKSLEELGSRGLLK